MHLNVNIATTDQQIESLLTYNKRLGLECNVCLDFPKSAMGFPNSVCAMTTDPCTYYLGTFRFMHVQCNNKVSTSTWSDFIIFTSSRTWPGISL